MSTDLPTLEYCEAKVVSHKLLAGEFRYLKFKSTKPLDFKPGQYISVEVAENTRRMYSLAACHSTTEFDLLVDTSPGGPGSKFFESLKVGDIITYMGPFGTFTFKKDDGADKVLFLATGSGISAIRCMIDKALLDYNIKKPISLYFGLRYPKEVFWSRHFKDLADRYPNFNFKITISRPDDSWKGPVGYVTKWVEKDFPNAKGCAAYLCGRNEMLSSASNLLIKNGCPKERIYTERFT